MSICFGFITCWRAAKKNAWKPKHMSWRRLRVTRICGPDTPKRARFGGWYRRHEIWDPPPRRDQSRFGLFDEVGEKRRAHPKTSSFSIFGARMFPAHLT